MAVLVLPLKTVLMSPFLVARLRAPTLRKLAVAFMSRSQPNNQSRTGTAWLNITGGIIASNVSYRSEGAGIRVGQMVDAMIKGASN